MKTSAKHQFFLIAVRRGSGSSDFKDHVREEIEKRSTDLSAQWNSGDRLLSNDYSRTANLDDRKSAAVGSRRHP
jgi:hypothetical protein